ncbi:MAG: ParA family protein, partial [Bacteriovoracaceae bacterium]
EYYAMEGFAQLLNTVKLIQQNLNPNLEREGILLTMYDGRNNLSKLVAQEIKGHFPEDTFKTIIPRNVKLSECPSHGKPIIIYDITSKGSEAYLNMAKEIILKEKQRALSSNDELSLKEQVVAKKADETNFKIPSFDDYQL